jgi:hypothetical protein
MSEQRHIPEPGETISTPSPSWGPAVFILGATGAVVGIYANGLAFSAFVWSYIGIVIMLFGFRMIVKRGERSYFTLPGHQRAQSATLPIEQIKFESRPTETQQRP